MLTFRTPIWLITLFLACVTAPAVAGKETKDDGKSVQDTATTVVNEIGKGLESVGKAVGPAINKAEKAVRGTAKSEEDKRNNK